MAKIVISNRKVKLAQLRYKPVSHNGHQFIQSRSCSLPLKHSELLHCFPGYKEQAGIPEQKLHLVPKPKYLQSETIPNMIQFCFGRKNMILLNVLPVCHAFHSLIMPQTEIRNKATQRDRVRSRSRPGF